MIIDFGQVSIFGFNFHLAIYSFGFMLVIAFYACYFFLNHDLKNLGYNDKLSSDIIFWAALGGVIGAKIYYLLENLDKVINSDSPLSIIFSGAGLVFLGGLLGAVICVSFILKNNKVPWLQFANIIAPLIFLGYAIGRLGCFLVGDDYGIPTNLPWGVSFPEGIPPTTETVHPTQLYESFICFILFGIMWHYRHLPILKDKLFFIYLVMAGIERFLIEFIRTNEKYFLEIFSGAQLISIFLIIIGIYFIRYPLNDNSLKLN